MSRQETSNTFSDGLIKDLNPINTPDTALTDCVNGTIITYDGNEYSLQNDRGNYALENCKLPDGYIPVGTAEYGGILYIVSYDPINKRTEIGSYPSTRVVTSLSSPDPEFKKGNSNSSISGKYSELSAKCKLNIFSGANPEEYKLYPGDGYKLSDKASSAVSRDEFFVVDENKALHDITDDIKVSNDEFIKVSWGVPGWIAVKTHIANIDSFGIGVRSVSFPTYIHADSKMKIKFRFRIIATDPLITNSNSGLSVTYTITDGSNTRSENKIAVTSSYSLGNGGKAYYLDTSDLEFPVREDTAITVTATPYFHDIEYDKCTTTYTYKVYGANDIENVSIGKEVWKYKTLDDRVLIDFSTEGLEGYKSISDLELKYSIYSLNDSKHAIISRASVNDWIFSGMSTDLEIPFSGDFVSENIYVIKFELLSIPSNNTSVPLYSTSQLLITTKLLNDKYGTVANFNNLEFGDWITEYKNYINNNNIKIEENSKGNATPIDVPSLNEFSPILITTGPYEDWKSGQESNNFNTLLSKSSYKKVTSAQEITVGRAYKYQKSFKLSTDTKLLAGPLWNDALQNCEANIWCNDTIKVPLTINTNGTVGSKDSTISGLCSIKSIYKPDALTNDGVRVWSYDLSSLDEVSNWTEEYIQCDLSTVKKNGENWERVKVRVTSSSYPSSPEILSNEGLTLKATTTLANKLKTYDVMFLDSITSCSAPKTDKLETYGATLNYKNIPNKPADIHSGNNRDPKHLYFMALPASPSYDKMQVIQIKNNSVVENDAKNIFKRTLGNLNKLVCYDDEITGGFVKLIKKDTKEDSIVEVSCNGKITLGSVKYLDQNILEESGRNGLIDYIKKKFPEDINYNLLKSVEDWTELSSVDLTPIKKSFKISNTNLQSRLKESLDNDDAIISKRNTLIEEQWNRSTDSIYITNLPNTVVYSKKDGVSIDDNINQILTLLNNKKQTTNTKAIYDVYYWNNGHKLECDRKLAFAYCDGTSCLI